jgi:hypothetical protein
MDLDFVERALLPACFHYFKTLRISPALSDEVLPLYAKRAGVSPPQKTLLLESPQNKKPTLAVEQEWVSHEASDGFFFLLKISLHLNFITPRNHPDKRSSRSGRRC